MGFLGSIGRSLKRVVDSSPVGQLVDKIPAPLVTKVPDPLDAAKAVNDVVDKEVLRKLNDPAVAGAVGAAVGAAVGGPGGAVAGFQLGSGLAGVEQAQKRQEEAMRRAAEAERAAAEEEQKKTQLSANIEEQNKINSKLQDIQPANLLDSLTTNEKIFFVGGAMALFFFIISRRKK